MISLLQIVDALSVTYTDSGVAMWLASRNSGLGGAAPIDVIARDPGGIERIADLVRAIGDADPQLFTLREDSPQHEFKGHLCIRCVPGQGHAEADEGVTS